MDELRKTNRYVPSLIATISINFAKPMFLCFELSSLVVQFYQLGFSMEFLNSIGCLAVLDKNRATKKSIDQMKLNYK